MRKLFLGMVAIAALLMGSCSADDAPAETTVQLDGGPSGGNGGITPPPPPPPGSGG